MGTSEGVSQSGECTAISARGPLQKDYAEHAALGPGGPDSKKSSSKAKKPIIIMLAIK